VLIEKLEIGELVYLSRDGLSHVSFDPVGNQTTGERQRVPVVDVHVDVRGEQFRATVAGPSGETNREIGAPVGNVESRVRLSDAAAERHRASTVRPM